jgi:hypothetical protein
MQVKAARESFTGKRLTQGQFDESYALAGIMAREIKRTGSFKEKLTGYSQVFSSAEKFDAMRAETIVRDQFKSRYGQTMNQMRESLIQRETNLGQSEKTQAMSHACNIGVTISEGETMPFYRAYDHQAVKLARSLDITETGAKTLMKDEYRLQNGKELYEDCKAIEKQYHLPKMEAKKNQRQAERTRSQSRSR